MVQPRSTDQYHDSHNTLSRSRSRSRSPSNERSHKRRAVRSHEHDTTSPINNTIQPQHINQLPIIYLGRPVSYDRQRTTRDNNSEYYNKHRTYNNNGNERPGDRGEYNDYMSYNEFVLTLPATVNPNDLSQQYEKYIQQYKQNKLKLFYDRYKSDDFLNDRYDIITRARHYRQLQSGYNQRSELICSQISSNICMHLDINKIDADNVKLPENALSITSIRSSVTRNQLYQFLSITPDSILNLFISDPFDRLNSKTRAIMRSAVVVYKTKQLAESSFNELQNRKLNLRENLVISLLHRNTTRKTAPNCMLQSDRIHHDLKQAIELVKKLDNEHNITNNKLFDNTAPIISDEFGSALRQLNAVQIYLHLVHHACYYCATVYNNYEHMFNTCGLLHSRSSQPSNNSAADDKYMNELDTAIELRLQRPTDIEQQYTNELNDALANIDEAAEQAAADTVYTKKFVELDTGDYVCGECNKPVTGRDDVQQHIDNKHHDIIDTAQQLTRTDAIYQAFCNDMIERDLVKYLPLPRSMNRSSYSPLNNTIKRPRSPRSNNYNAYQNQRYLAHDRQSYDRRTTYPQVNDTADQPIPRRPLRSYADLNVLQSDTFVPSYDLSRPIGAGFRIYNTSDIKKKMKTTDTQSDNVVYQTNNVDQ